LPESPELIFKLPNSIMAILAIQQLWQFPASGMKKGMLA
jgi:hypothetical protein